MSQRFTHFRVKRTPACIPLRRHNIDQIDKIIVDHPRWSQATERFIGPGGTLSVKRQPTLLFNGYADEVASLYRGLDLRENY